MKRNDLHRSIYEYLKTNIPSDSTDSLDQIAFNYDEAATLRILFKNFRPISRHGLRLTDTGLWLLSRHFDHWEFDISNTSREDFSRNILFLDANCKMPWHLISMKSLTLFDSEIAFRLKIIGNLTELRKTF